MDTVTVPLLALDGSMRPGVFTFDRRARDVALTLTWEGRDMQVEALDYFECLCQVRRKLELEGLRPLCYGADRTAYPSGMGRDMGRGLKVYKNHLGKRAFLNDLVDTFAVGDDVDPVTVEEQWQFHLDWLESIGFHLPPNYRNR